MRPVLNYSAILIAGPTASGKSALAFSLAKKHGLAILNADSMQVYADLKLLSARETPQTPHHLFGFAPATQNYSVGHYVQDVERLLPTVHCPIFVGGTGLYFKALCEGLSPLPPVPQDVRQAVRDETLTMETAQIHALLDADAKATLRESDRMRVQRALEVYRATGKSIVEWQKMPREKPLLQGRVLKIFLSPPRVTLMSRIDSRFEAMISEGALAEVKALAAQNLDPMLPIMRAHGVPPLLKFLRGETSLEEAVTQAKQDTRHYAKRQFTWFRNQMQDFIALDPLSAEEELDANYL